MALSSPRLSLAAGRCFEQFLRSGWQPDDRDGFIKALHAMHRAGVGHSAKLAEQSELCMSALLAAPAKVSNEVHQQTQFRRTLHVSFQL